MAPQNKNKDKVAENTDVVVDTEKEKLKSELDELKQLVAQLLKDKQESSANVSVATDPQEIEEDVAIIPPNKMINVTSLFYGGMTLTGNNKRIRFERFGVTQPVSFEDLTHICSNHRNLAEEGAFFIHNKDAVKSLYLEDNYKKFINKQTIENFITLPEEQMRSMFKNTTKEIQETIVDLVIDGVKKYIKGEDSKYSNRNKVEIISELSGKNIYQLANEAVEQEKK